jgi:hypothetical protein
VDNDCLDELSQRLAYLASYGQGSGKATTTRCWIWPDLVSKDFRNFEIRMEIATGYDGSKPKGERFKWETMFYGGLIYHHRPEQKTRQHCWGVHT